MRLSHSGFVAVAASLLVAAAVQGGDKVLNLSARGFVGAEGGSLFGGFITQGTQPTRVVLRALGPSLADAGVERVVVDPMLSLHDGNGNTIQKNDDWRSGPDAGAIQDIGLAPSREVEAALLATLPPGVYTLVVSGHGSGATLGAGLVEMYDLQDSTTRFGNISARGFLHPQNTADRTMIAGFIIGGETAKDMVVRAVGTWDFQPDTILDLYDGNGEPIASNDDWQQDERAADVQRVGLAPKQRESALFRTLTPGAYTGVVGLRSDSTTSSIALIEVYDVSPQAE